MTTYLEYEETFRVEDLSPALLHDLGERVMKELLLLENGADRLHDSAVSTDSHQMTITVEMAKLVEDDEDISQAKVALRSAARTAFHVVGGATPDWDLERVPDSERTALVTTA